LCDLSILIPAVDMYEMTRRCVETVAENTPPGYELIIVADECNEEMLAWLKGLDAKVITNTRRVGSTTAFNMGLREATRKYIAMVVNDVTVTKGWLEPLITALDRNPGFGWVASRVMRGNFPSNFGTACQVFLKEALDRVGLFDERFSQGIGWDDNDLLLRFWLAGYQPHGIIKSTVYHPAEATTLKALHGDTRPEKYALSQGLFIEKWGPEVMKIDWVNIPCIDEVGAKCEM